MNTWINDNYYKANSEKVLGEAKEKKNAFGKMVTYYVGDASKALEQIKATNPSYIILSKKDPKESKTVSLTQKEKRIDQAMNKAEEEEKEMEKAIHAEDLDLISFEEIDAIYNKHLSKEQKQVFVWYMRSLGRKMEGGWTKYHVPMLGSTGHPKELENWVKKGLVCYNGKEHLPRFLFVSGNVYETQELLKEHKSKIIQKYGETVYENQLIYIRQSLDRLNNRYLSLNAKEESKRLRLLATDRIAKTYEIKTLADGKAFKGRKSEREDDYGEMDFRSDSTKDIFDSLDLQTAFIWWMRENTDKVFVKHGLAWDDLRSIAIKQRPRGRHELPDEFERKKKNAKDETERLFHQFLTEAISEEDRLNIEKSWNANFNGVVPIDYMQVPIGFSMARYYRGVEMDIREEKREAIAASMIQGSLCIAYGVGLGKTWCAIFCMAQFLENAWASRPLLAVPLQVYPQFVREIQGILPQYRVNQLGNLSSRYNHLVLDEEGMTKALPMKSITVITYHGFKQIGFSERVSQQLIQEINAIFRKNDSGLKKPKSKRAKAAESQKIEGMVGSVLRNTKIDIDRLGVDFIAMDEAHAAKKIFTAVAAEINQKGSKERSEYKINAGTPSAMGLKTFALTQYVQHINSTGNVLLLSATPFTNSPLEVFSMLSLLAYKELKKVGLNSVKNFFDKFVLVKTELVIDASLNPVRKEVFKGFANLVGLQGFIRRYFLYKQKTKGLKRPEKYLFPSKQDKRDSIIALGEEQAKIMRFITDFVENKANLPKFQYQYEIGQAPKLVNAGLSVKDILGARVLLSVSLARALALSPYLFPYQVDGVKLPPLNYKTYVETSAKLMYTMRCIQSVKEAHEKKKEAVSGQIVYMNLGVKYFPLIKEYLVKELGFKEYEVGIIQGTMPKHEDKAAVQDLFLGRRLNPATQEYEDLPDEWRVKVLLGSNSITEGINLQTHCSVIYNLFLPWNPTDTVQLEGRGWRQGNQYKNIRIVYPLLEDSMDIFMFQKLDEKTTRINQIWNFDGQTSMLDLSDFDPSELKYQIIKDPMRLAAVEAEEKRALLYDEIDDIKIEIRRLEGIQKRTKHLISLLKEYKDRILYIGNQEPKALEKLKAKLAKIEEEPIYRRYAFYDRIYKKRKEEQTLINRAVHSYVLRKEHEDKGIKGAYRTIQTNDRFVFAKYDSLRYKTDLKNFLSPRNLKGYGEELRNYIKQRNEASLLKQETLENVANEDAIKQRAREIQEEKMRKGIKSKTTTQAVKEFGALNHLLHEKRVDTIIRPLAKLPKHSFTQGKTVDINWNGRKKKAKILKRINHHEVPMYRVQYKLGGGYQQTILETEILSIPKRSKYSIKTKTEIEVFVFKMKMQLELDRAKLALMAALGKQTA